MFQIDTSTAATTQPASTSPGTPGFFTDGSPTGGVAPTIVPAEWLNAVMLEICNAITASGQALSKNTFNQLALAMQKSGSNYAVDTGAANAYVCAFVPAITARGDGMPLRFKAKAANTAGCTLNDGLGAVQILGAAHTALQGGEIVANGDVWVIWNSSLNAGAGAYVMLDSTGGSVQVGTATQSQHAVPLSQIQAAIQENLYSACSAGGTSDALTGSFTPAITSTTMASGVVEVTVRAVSANATATPTFTPNSGVIAPAVIVKGAGAALAPGDIAGAGHWITLQWDATLSRWVLLNPATGVAAQTVASIRGTRSGLVISYSGTSAAVTVTANELTLENVSGAYTTLRGLNLSANSGSASGVANSLDTGAWAYGTFYNLFVIYNPTTQTSALLWSLSSTAPTLPSGYTYFARVGANRTQTATNYWFLVGSQADTFFTYGPLAGANLTTSPSLASGSTSGMISTAAFSPPTAGMNYIVGGAGTSGQSGSINISLNSASIGLNVGASSVTAVSATILLPNSARNFYYSSSLASGFAAMLGWIDLL